MEARALATRSACLAAALADFLVARFAADVLTRALIFALAEERLALTWPFYLMTFACLYFSINNTLLENLIENVFENYSV